MDVVPVYEEQWTHPPFGAEMDDDGKIFARGAQDMKSVGMQYLGAINALKSNGVRLKRTLHVTYVPGKIWMVSKWIDWVSPNKFEHFDIDFV